MPTPVQNANQVQRLQRAFGFFGKFRMLLDEVIVPVAVVEDLTTEAPAQLLQATLVVQAPAAGVGITSAALLGNIGASGVDLLLDEVWVVQEANTIYEIGQTTIAAILPIAASTITKTWNDPTQAGTPAGTGFANNGIFIGSGPIARGHLNVRRVVRYPVMQVIPPNNQVYVNNNVTNVGFDCWFQYRVRTTV